MILHVLEHSFEDTLRIVPFLFLTYLVMEYLEHKTQEKSKQIMKKSGKLGPLLGSITGIVPQCGFSAAAASLYSGGVITVGTLLAIFLSTSDEMLPIFISEAVPAGVIFKILGMKVVLAAASGFIIDILWRFGGKKRREHHHIHKEHHEKDIHDLCEHEHCGCEEGSILKSAMLHTIQITIFIFLVTAAITFAVELVGEAKIGAMISRQPIVGVFLAAFVGMIPNCAASVVITQLYLAGVLGAGQMIAGLLTGTGVGILVLFRTNPGIRENLGILGILYGTGVFWGIAIEALKIVL